MSIFDLHSRQRWLWLVVASVVAATALSMSITGFTFGVGNNVFHIPYVLRYGELAQFRDDALYRSLDQFASLVWPLIRLISNESNIKQIFLVADLAGRLMAFAALLWFFCANGISKMSTLWLLLLTTAACAWLVDSSLLGSHGMFLGYFTHSEVTWGPLVAALVAAQRERLVLAAMFAGLVFSVNAFVGIWLAVILGCTILASPHQWRDWKTLAWATLTFFLFCSLVVVWIASDIGRQGEVPNFNYIGYIRTYYSKHFLIEVATPEQILTVVLLAWCGFVAAYLHGRAQFWMAVVSGCVLLLLVGAGLPYLVNQRFAFNLHLLRSDGVLQFVAAMLSIAAAVPVLFDAQASWAQRIVALLALSFLLSPPLRWSSALICALALTTLVYLHTSTKIPAPLRKEFVMPLVYVAALGIDLAASGLGFSLVMRWGLLLCAGSALFVGRIGERRVFVIAAVVWSLLIVLSLVTFVRWRTATQDDGRNAQSIVDMMRWVKASRLQGPFLFPVDAPHRSVFEHFQLMSMRTVWVDWKQGAAVMWAPSFHFQWTPRYLEVSRLHTSRELAVYAQNKHIAWLVLPADMGNCPAGTTTIYRNAGAAVCSVDAGSNQ